MKLKNNYDNLVSNNVVMANLHLIDKRKNVYLDLIVGYCHCDTHKGYLTSNLLKGHGCLDKKCPFLEKYSDFPFWDKYNTNVANKLKRKAAIKLNKKLATIRKVKEREKIRFISEIADDVLEYFNFSIKITSIKKDVEFDYVINYVSEESLNDWHRYIRLVKELHRIFGYTFKLNHIKTVDGKYATIKDYKNKKK